MRCRDSFQSTRRTLFCVLEGRFRVPFVDLGRVVSLGRRRLDKKRDIKKRDLSFVIQKRERERERERRPYISKTETIDYFSRVVCLQSSSSRDQEDQNQLICRRALCFRNKGIKKNKRKDPAFEERGERDRQRWRRNFYTGVFPERFPER